MQRALGCILVCPKQFESLRWNSGLSTNGGNGKQSRSAQIVGKLVSRHYNRTRIGIVNLNPICEIIKIGSVIVAEFEAINSLMKSPCADKEALIINRSKNNNIAGFL
jgi:hypothetical protein